MSDVNPLSIVGLLLTLASIIGTFFYLQLTQWVRDLLALEQKLELTRTMSEDDQGKYRIEARIEKRRLDNTATFIVDGTVIGFVAFVIIVAFAMIAPAAGDPSYPFVLWGLIGFALVFCALTAFILVQAVRSLTALRTALPSTKKT